MRALLDTHAFLWFVDNSLLLSSAARAAIEDDGADAFISIASIWEIGIKVQLGKLALSQSFDEVFPAQLEANGISLLSPTIEHVSHLVTLPRHHRDPFDRMLVAQAIVEGLTLVSRDDVFDQYPVTRLW